MSKLKWFVQLLLCYKVNSHIIIALSLGMHDLWYVFAFVTCNCAHLHQSNFSWCCSDNILSPANKRVEFKKSLLFINNRATIKVNNIELLKLSYGEF